MDEGQEWMAAKVKKGRTPRFPEDVESQSPGAGATLKVEQEQR